MGLIRRLKVAFTVLVALSMATTGAFLLARSSESGYRLVAGLMELGVIVLGAVVVRMRQAPEPSIERPPRAGLGARILFVVLFVPVCWWIFEAVFHLDVLIGN